MGKLYNLARMTTATTSTGTITLGSAVSGYLTFALAGVSNAETVSYAIKDGANSEIGEGVYTTSGTTLTRTVTKSTNSNTAINLSGTAEVFITPRAEDLRAVPTIQTFTSGTAATYTTPANCLWIEVSVVAGGGGGSGAQNSGSTIVAGSDGTASSFNSVVANPGKGGTGSSSGGVFAGGAGGVGGTGTATRRMPGHPGGGGSTNVAQGNPSGNGGGSVLLGGGGVGVSNGATAGNAGATNSGGGGGGAYNNGGSNNNTGPGGGGGESLYLIITNPSATYAYTVGPGGAGGSSSTTGGAGATGWIQVIEHYN
jgi:hypothetical protein